MTTTPVRSRCPLLLAALALAGTASAQLAIVRPDGASDIPITAASLEVGAAPAGDFLDTRLRVRNTGVVAAVLSTIEISGVGFSLEGTPPLPLTMPANGNADFRVRFRPSGPGSYSGTLRVNRSISLLIRGSAAAGLSLLLERDRSLITIDRTLEFGTVTAGERGRLALLIRNEAAGEIPVRQLNVAGTGFLLSQDLPSTVKAGEEARFEILCAPVKSGFLSGTLHFDGRTFTLAALAREPETPSALIELDADAARSGKQSRVRVKLAAPARVSVGGTLRLEFKPAVEASAGDAAIQFLGNSSREIPVFVEAGSAAVALQDKPDAVFQTGTTAGTIVLRLKLGSEDREISIAVPPEAPRVDTVEMKRGAGSVEVVVTGFDNHRTSGNIVFTFTDAAGRDLPAVSAEAGPSFARYFRESEFGGLFRLRASFPVTGGDAASLARVAVKLANGIGASAGRSE